jgi:hypothetical protein
MCMRRWLRCTLLLTEKCHFDSYSISEHIGFVMLRSSPARGVAPNHVVATGFNPLKNKAAQLRTVGLAHIIFAVPTELR